MTNETDIMKKNEYFKISKTLEIETNQNFNCVK